MSSGRLQSVSTCFPGEMAPGSLYQPRMGGTMNDAATAPTIAPIIMKTRTVFTTPPRCSVPSYATRGGGKGTPGAAPGGPGVPRPPASETCADTYFSALTVRGSSHGAEGPREGRDGRRRWPHHDRRDPRVTRRLHPGRRLHRRSLRCPPALRPRGREAEHGHVAVRHAGARQHAALPEEAVQAPEVVVRHGHQQVVLQVIVDVVGCDEEALPP